MSDTETAGTEAAGTETAGTETAPEGDLQEATVRRAPKYAAFIVVGALVGFLATAIVTMQFPADPAVGLIASVAYFSLFGVSAGVAVGALVAIILDRRSLRRTRAVSVEHAEVGDPFDPDAEQPAAEEDSSAPVAAETAEPGTSDAATPDAGSPDPTTK